MSDDLRDGGTAGPVPEGAGEEPSATAPSEPPPGDTAPARGGGEAEPDDRTAALNAAIGELEQVLSEHGLDPAPPEPRVAPASRGRPAADGGEPYTIPLLHDVVVPSAEADAGDDVAAAQTSPGAAPARGAPAVPRAPPPPGEDRVAREAERYRPLFERLSSEIEVIVQTGVEEALQAASKEIVRKVNDHLAIVLPEVLDELSHLEREKD